MTQTLLIFNGFLFLCEFSSLNTKSAANFFIISYGIFFSDTPSSCQNLAVTNLSFWKLFPSWAIEIHKVWSNFSRSNCTIRWYKYLCVCMCSIWSVPSFEIVFQLRLHSNWLMKKNQMRSPFWRTCEPFGSIFEAMRRHCT